MSDLNFKEWLGEDHWKALKHGVRTGKKAYSKKRMEQKKTKSDKKDEKPEKTALAGENLHRWLTEKKLLAPSPLLT
jgi:hypothetical protein